MARFNFFVLAAVSTLLVGCLNESNADVSLSNESHILDASVLDASAGTDAGTNPSGSCAPVSSAMRLPARAQALKGAQRSATQTVYVDQLYYDFASQCGGCHIDVGLGNYQTSRATFSDDITQDWIDSIGLNNTKTVMPPPSVGGKIASERTADDPANLLQKELQAWVDQGRRHDVFQMPVDAGSTAGPYQLDSDLANALTNIGNCWPDAALYASDTVAMDLMDQKFANMTYTLPGQGTRLQQIGLPQFLNETDLTSFDSAELAKTGVISYAVAYPRWIDPDAAVMRHMRLPRGQSVVFNKASQSFRIPEGTRFYKTIVQRVLDASGNPHWRKMETQMIVVWSNLKDASGATGVGSAAVSALFGTYAWSDDESQATLVTDPYKDGSAFRDHIVTYVSDEAKYATVLATNPPNSVYSLRDVKALRSYAIPGSKRCMQCHVGSSTSNFVLGFQPLQVARRNQGESGVIEQAGADELQQLNRFIQLGVITGVEVESAGDILPLEKSQANTPRNDYELKAQGYLLGNCAHCHNPKGDPSLENPSLSDLLNFQPNANGGGIFQFPLDRMSPRIFRGAGTGSASTQMPYVTPSVLDQGVGAPASDWTFLASKCSYDVTYYPIMAPWRSLIYRGVDTPFTYSDDLALMPHMPMNTQSFDCRAPQIVGDWMVSIPAVLADDTASEFRVRDSGDWGDNLACTSLDQSTQPYLEVGSDTLAFDSAITLANQRRDKYHNSPVAPWLAYIPPTNMNPNPQEPVAPSRYNYCPDNYDIFDPAVLKNPTLQPVPGDARVMDSKNQQMLMPVEGVPNHAHWVIYDPTQVPGDWAPRRPDWDQVLVSQNLPSLTTLMGTALYLAQQRQSAEKVVVSVLQSVTLSPQINSLAEERIPIGLWKTKPSCNFTGVGKVADYKTTTSGSTQYAAAWMQTLANTNQIKDSDPVYELTPGETIHDMICSSCHGFNADSTGRQATILSEMTGGNANVTNLRDGIMQQSNRNAVFSSAPLASATINDWAARYFAWMALGGTKQTIPTSILALVANASVAGTARPMASVPTDANMLSSAYRLCGYLLPAKMDPTDPGSYGLTSGGSVLHASGFSFEGGMFAGDPKTPQSSLIFQNGDVLLWERVCSADNPPPIRVVSVDSDSNGTISLAVVGQFLYRPDLYPPNAQIVDHRGNVVTGVTDANYFPWCLAQPNDAAEVAVVDAWRSSNLATNKQQIPYCPATDMNGKPYIPAAYRSGGGPITTSAAALDYDAADRWVVRGATNAGLMVYAYLNLLASGALKPTPAFDQCDSLGTSN